MQKIIFTIFIIATSFCFAQEKVISLGGSLNDPSIQSNPLLNTGTYYKDVDNKFDKWVGTWQYENGNTLFKIVITKIVKAYVPANTYDGRPGYCYLDMLIGGYYYKENGVIKTNHLTFTNKFRPPLDIPGSTTYVTPDEIKMNYDEIDKSPELNGHSVHFTLLPNSTTQAKWEFDSTKKRAYSVPDNLILTKL